MQDVTRDNGAGVVRGLLALEDLDDRRACFVMMMV
jgi:hypothetical protein